jgi:hypothetical protein
MNRIRLVAAALTATAALGCDSSPTDPPGPQVVSVTVTPASATLPAIGATVQLSARATDDVGNVVTGRTVTWSSSASGVASVDATGLVTGVSLGTAAITATVDGVSGGAVVDVQQCLETETVNLSAGAWQVFESTDCLVLPSGASGDRYRVAVLRLPGDPPYAKDSRNVTLRVAGLGVTQAPESAPSLAARSALDLQGFAPRLDRSTLRQGMALAESTSRFHARLRGEEERLMARLGPESLLPGNGTRGPQAVSAAPSPQKVTFNISIKSDCTTTADDLKVGVLLHENDDVAIYQDSIQRATKPIPVGLAQDMADYHRDYGKGVIRDYFGVPSDVDANGKVVVFASPAAGDSVAAFVWSGDFFTKEGQNSCPASNEMELVYFNTDLILSMEGGDSYQALATLTHEVKHVVSLYNRVRASLRAGSSRFHPSWIEEGTAEIAGEMGSRVAWAATGGPAVHERVIQQDFRDSGFTSENWGVVLHLARTAWYLSSQPNGLVVSPDDAQEGHSVYGSGWLFHRWLGDAYGGGGTGPYADATIFRSLNDSLAPGGTAGLVQATGKPFQELVEEFVATTSLHATGPTAPALDFAMYDFVESAEIFCNPDPLGAFPWPVTTTGTPGDCEANIDEAYNLSATFRTAEYTGPIGTGGVRIHDLRSNGTGTGAQIQVEMTPPGKIVVARVR